MAYLAFDFQPAVGTGAVMPCDEPEAAFTRLEWRVIFMAKRDPATAGRARSWQARIARLLFGVRTTNPLADQRLETLRQTAARLWRRKGQISQARIDRLRSAGFTLPQIALLSCWIAEQP